MIRNYADGFYLSFKEDKSEFMIDFFQLEPVLESDDENEDVQMRRQEVSKIKFDKEVAENLYKMLEEIFSDN